MKPLVPGRPTGLVEIPANWYLDDLPPMMFIKKAPNSHGWVNPRDVEDLWRDHFDYFYREYDDFCFPVTIHPDVSGHPHVISMLERSVSAVLGTMAVSKGANGESQIDRIRQQQGGRRMGEDGGHLRRLQEEKSTSQGSAVASRARRDCQKSQYVKFPSE